MMRLLPWFAALCLQGCAIAVVAQGHISLGSDGRAWISASNGKSYPIATTPASEPLRHLDGALVQLDGRLASSAVTVDSWRVLQGRLGFSAFYGILGEADGGYAIRDPRDGTAYRLTGDLPQDVQSHLGKPVLVEGAVDGPMSVHVLSLKPLYGPVSP